MAFRSELLSFPRRQARRSGQVDALGLIGQVLDARGAADVTAVDRGPHVIQPCAGACFEGHAPPAALYYASRDNVIIPVLYRGCLATICSTKIS